MRDCFLIYKNGNEHGADVFGQQLCDGREEKGV